MNTKIKQVTQINQPNTVNSMISAKRTNHDRQIIEMFEDRLFGESSSDTMVTDRVTDDSGAFLTVPFTELDLLGEKYGRLSGDRMVEYRTLIDKINFNEHSGKSEVFNNWRSSLQKIFGITVSFITEKEYLGNFIDNLQHSVVFSELPPKATTHSISDIDEDHLAYLTGRGYVPVDVMDFGMAVYRLSCGECDAIKQWRGGIFAMNDGRLLSAKNKESFLCFPSDGDWSPDSWILLKMEGMYSSDRITVANRGEFDDGWSW